MGHCPCGNLYHTGSDFMNTQVLYVSGTGNTAAVAKEIFQALPSSSNDIQELDHAKNPLSADCYFIGFWANRGTANVEILDFLSELHGKKVALFGTCGMGNSPEYMLLNHYQIHIFYYLHCSIHSLWCHSGLL